MADNDSSALASSAPPTPRVEAGNHSPAPPASRKRPLSHHSNTSNKRLSDHNYMHSRTSLGTRSPNVPIDTFKLNRNIESKLEQRITLKTNITSLQNHNNTQELANVKLEDEYHGLKRKLNLINEQITQLQNDEKQSLQFIEDKFQINSKKLKIEFNERISHLKERISTQIDQKISENLHQLTQEKTALTSTCQSLQQEIDGQKTDLNRKLIKLKEDFNRKKNQVFAQLNETLAGLQEDIAKLDSVILNKTEEHDALTRDLADNLQQVNSRLNAKLESVRQISKSKEADINQLKNAIISKRHLNDNVKSSIMDKQNQLKFFQMSITEINETLARNEHQRRMLHNKLQNLKGNIRVYCRVRPPPPPSTPSSSSSSKSPSKCSADDIAQIEYPDNEFNEDACQVLILSKPTSRSSFTSHNNNNNNNKNIINTPTISYKFQFDKVFSPDSTNEQVFDELSQLIQSSLDGFNVCVFAYGQTGSGKTWTMSHPTSGMIPLSISKIFDDIADLKHKDWDYTLEGQFIEIYNESIIDLLTTPNNKSKYEIKHDDIKGKTTITNVTSVSISSKEQAQLLLDRASRNRSTASTMSNERSSRSHSIFILKIIGHNTKTGKDCEGTLNLVDLAGSERLTASQAKGDRLKETQAINKSLSCLGDVIHSLGQQQSHKNGMSQPHIPYRNSKLTYLLKHSLGGDSKTLMFVNISPLSKNFGETLNSLRFATKVNNTQVNSLNK